MKNNAKRLLLGVFFVLIVVILFTKKNTTTAVEPTATGSDVSAISPILNAAMISLIDGKERSELWPGYMVLFSDEDSTVFFIGSLLYFEEGCKGFEVINDIIFAFYEKSGSSSFQQNFVSLESLSIKEISCCSYENDKHAGVPAFDEEYFKFYYKNENLLLVDKGRVESLPIRENVTSHEIILKIKGRLFVPPPP